ncbi:MAG: TfuA-like protein [Dehalococcoidia bacterium]
MTVYVFTGPTLSPDEARAQLDAVCLPPVSQGDVYRASLTRPEAIGIIDGYFERVPAVWHKEILWAMHQGIHVFGSASMGALRAAELAPFGMEGVGAIFEAFRDGSLTDDDEVAVAHGSAEAGYQAQSEAMVNIRRTLAEAGAAGVIGPATRDALAGIAKATFYPERGYARLLRRSMEAGVPATEVAALRAWLPRGRVDQKRADALAMLRVMRERLSAGLAPKRVDYAFEYTDAWDAARRSAGDTAITSNASIGAVEFDAILDELRLVGDAYARARHATLARSLAIQSAQRHGMAVTPELLGETATAFRRERGLLKPEALDRWLEQNGLTGEGFMRLMEDEARLRWMESVAEAEIISTLPDCLRVSGGYTRLLERARDKRSTLEARGLGNPSLGDAGLTLDDLTHWYFEVHLRRPIPADIMRFVRDAGFEGYEAFTREILREYCYVAGKS